MRAHLPDAALSGLWRLLPSNWLPFVQLARVDRPAGWQLLLAPCLNSVCLAGVYRAQKPDFLLLLLFTLGAIAMRGAGSTFNDLIDRNIDAQVERTRGRPLPSGRVSMLAAAFFMAAQALVGLGVLLSLNNFSIVLGFASLLPVAAYPFMKRFTSLAAGGARPRFFLGRADGLGGADRRTGRARPYGFTPPAWCGRSAMTRSTP